MNIIISKVQLRHERSTLESLINRYGDITLKDAHDRVSVDLDYTRGAGLNRKRKKSSVEKECLEWMV
jgi:hypothetical protein